VGLAVLGLALVGCGAPSVVASLSPAEAQRMYLAQVQSLGVPYHGSDLPMGDGLALRLGQQVCSAMRNPQLGVEHVGAALTSSGDVSARDAGSLVGAAVGNLCPDLRHKLG
jgi:hypothetical protein